MSENINKKNYNNLPDYLKNDTQVIDKMIENDISAIEVLPDNLAIEYIKRNPDILGTIFFSEKGLRQHYVEMEPELFDSLPQNSKLELIFIDEQYQYIKELDEDFQTELLTSSPSIPIPILQQKMNSITSNCGKIINEQPLTLNCSLVNFKINSAFFAENLNYFNENVIYNVVKNNSEIVKLFDFKKLTPDIQINIAQINNSLLLKMDKDVIEKFFEKKAIKEIFKLQINDKDKFQLIKMLGKKIDIETLIESNISNELTQLLKDEISDDDLKHYCKMKFPESLCLEDYDYTKKRIKFISIFGKRIDEYLSENQKNESSIFMKIFNNFDEEYAKLLFKSRQIEMHFDKKNVNFHKSDYHRRKEILSLIQEIYDKDNGLQKLKGYFDFRRKNTDLDLAESLLKSIDEYKKYGDLYNNLLENFEMFTEKEKAEFKDRWTDLMNLNNKFKIKNIQDFKNIDEIEKNFYLERLDWYNTPSAIKREICSILVRNPEIWNIEYLGNGTEYSMKNKSLEDVVDILSTLNEITDVETLKGIMKDCIEMIGTEELKNIRSIGRNIEEKIVQEYREGYSESLTNYEEMSDEELSKMEGIRVERINNVRVIHLEGIDFSFLAHIGDISGVYHRCCCSYITNENFATQNDGLIKGGDPYIFSKINPKRIKYINVSDAGGSKYENGYISHKDLPMASRKASEFGGRFNEVTFSTLNEDGDDKQEVKTTTKMITSKYYDRDRIYLNSKDERNPRTLFVLHEEIYLEKNKQQNLEKEELLKKYFDSLDFKFIDTILQNAEENADLVMSEITKIIMEHIDEKFGKNKLRKNYRRYSQLCENNRGKGDTQVNSQAEHIKDKIMKVLEQMDNEFLTENSFRDKIKEVSDKYGNER